MLQKIQKKSFIFEKYFSISGKFYAFVTVGISKDSRKGNCEHHLPATAFPDIIMKNSNFYSKKTKNLALCEVLLVGYRTKLCRQGDSHC